MSWQTLARFVATFYRAIADGVYALVGEDLALRILALVFTAVMGGLLFCAISFTTDELAEYGVAMSVRIAYAILRFTVLYPLLFLTILAAASGYMNCDYYVSIPVVSGMATAFCIARRRSRRSQPRTQLKG